MCPPPLPAPSPQYLDSKLEAHLKLDWYNEQAVKSEARRQANQPVINFYFYYMDACMRFKVVNRRRIDFIGTPPCNDSRG